MSVAYTQEQVAEALKKQGYSDKEAVRMANAIGPVDKQDSNILPNIAEATAFAGASHLIDTKMKAPTSRLGKTGHFVLKGIPGSLAYLGASALTGNNYAEKASMGQALGDMAGGFGGSYLGEAAGKAFSSALKSGAAKAGSAAAGRGTGALLGSAAGPIGSIVGGVLGSWLVPKLFKNADENYLEPEKGMTSGTAAALSGAALLASPVGRPIRQAIGKTLPIDVQKGFNEIKSDLKKDLSETKLGAAYLEPFSKNTPPQNVSPWGWDNLKYNVSRIGNHIEGLENTMSKLGTMAGEYVRKKRSNGETV